MCGITGLFFRDGFNPEQTGGVVRAMTDALTHRGPDDSDTWLDENAGIALGHRRLSILDLSPLGRQPMHSQCGNYVIVYNGEVYNHLELREDLATKGHTFAGGSDTETILAALTEWGVHEALQRFIGMFAIALWDRREQKLRLIRDRLGIKPLYFGQVGNGWLFGSELSALMAHPECSPAINRDALALFFRYGYFPSPHTVHDTVFKVEPGQIVTLSAQGMDASRWWDTRDVWRKGETALYSNETDCIDELETLLSDAVQKRMLSDVPLGAFLSGGIDSSTVVALMQAASTDKVRTFSIGFHSDGYNEAEHAKAVAAHLGTDHTELYVSPEDLLATVPNLPRYWDEPFADSSQIPTLILSRLTRKHVTVSLSGDGGDELFSGYERYFWNTTIWNTLRRIPSPVRSTAAGLAKCIPAHAFRLMGALGQKACWRLDALKAPDFEALYRYFFSHNHAPEALIPGAIAPQTALDTVPLTGDPWRWMSEVDMLQYLPDDILTKVDRASMAVGLEARVPLIDHRLVEFAACVPTSFKVRDGKGKWLLRQVLYKHVPQALVDRPKMGFGVPIHQWLRHELKPWAEDMLNSNTLRRQGHLNADAVATMWRRFLRGETHFCHALWDVLMFQAWLDMVETS